MNDESWRWRALRLLAKKTPHFFTYSNDPITNVPDYLDSIIRKIVKETSFQSSESAKQLLASMEVKPVAAASLTSTSTEESKGGDHSGKHHGHYNNEDSLDLRAQGERYRQRAGEAAKRSHNLLAQSQASLNSCGVDFEHMSELIFPLTGRLDEFNRVISILRVTNRHFDMPFC